MEALGNIFVLFMTIVHRRERHVQVRVTELQRLRFHHGLKRGIPFKRKNSNCHKKHCEH